MPHISSTWFIGCLNFWVYQCSLFDQQNSDLSLWKYTLCNSLSFQHQQGSVKKFMKNINLILCPKSQGEYRLFSIQKSVEDFQNGVRQASTVTRKAFGLGSAGELENLSVNAGLPPGALRVGAACLGFSSPSPSQLIGSQQENLPIFLIVHNFRTV